MSPESQEAYIADPMPKKTTLNQAAVTKLPRSKYLRKYHKDDDGGETRSVFSREAP